MSVISLKNISKIYGSGSAKVSALEDINFEANEGEVVIIIGPSGGGKSTFLTITGVLQQPSSGTVKINNQDISKIKTKEANYLRLNKIGFLLQAYNLIPYLTVEEQFELVDKVKHHNNMSHNDLRILLNQLGINNLLHKYPNELSGGQKQRAAIARALYTNPQIILADEPTAALDSEKVEEVGQLFSDLAKKQGKTILLVTHDMRLKKYADKLFEMVDGHLNERNIDSFKN